MLPNVAGIKRTFLRRFRSADSEEGRRPTARELELEHQVKELQLRVQQLQDELKQRDRSNETGFWIFNYASNSKQIVQLSQRNRATP